jgi:hypothetical protein
MTEQALKEYTVSWTIQVDALTPEEAARRFQLEKVL